MQTNSNNTPKLSVVVITKNEAKMISECLNSVDFADEIVLVDSGSTDDTIKIARAQRVRVVNYTGGSFSDWRKKGMTEASHNWILYIDADERVSPELRQEIVKLLRSQKANVGAYAIPRKNFIFGKAFKHCGQWPDYVKRLFRRKDLVGWRGDLHEEPIFKGELGYLNNPLVHIKHENISEMVDKTNKWSNIEAKLMFDTKHPKMNALRFASAGFREFWLRFIRQTAFLDGPEGIIYGLYQVFSRLVSYSKLWEMQLGLKK